MAVEVILPKVDMDMDTGSISKWHVKDGETVKKGQAVFEIETDKSAMEIESPADGVIKISSAKEGEAIAIGTVVAMIYGAGEEAKAFVGAVSNATTSPAKVDVAVSAKPTPGLRGNDSASGTGVRATPLARRLAKQAGVVLTTLKGTGPRGRITAADVQSRKAGQASCRSCISACVWHGYGSDQGALQ